LQPRSPRIAEPGLGIPGPTTANRPTAIPEAAPMPISHNPRFMSTLLPRHQDAPALVDLPADLPAREISRAGVRGRHLSSVCTFTTAAVSWTTSSQSSAGELGL